jgi:hypothetical protein
VALAFKDWANRNTTLASLAIGGDTMQQLAAALDAKG